MKRLRQVFLFLSWGFLLLTGHNALAQKTISISAPNDSLSAPNGALVGTSLKIINHQNTAFKGKLLLSSNEFLGIVGKGEEKIALNPKDSSFVSVNIIVSQVAEAGKEYGVSASLYDSSGGLVFRKDISVRVVKTKKMRLFVRDKQILMEKRDGIFEIPVRLQNQGNTIQEVVLLVKLPSELHEGYQSQKTYEIGAFQDTIVNISQQVTREMMAVDNFSIYITGVYKEGDVFGRESVQVTAIRSNRKFRPHGEIFPKRENQLLLRTRNPGDKNAVYDGALQADIKLPNEGIFELNANATWRQQVDELYFRNSWIGYRNNRFGGRLGNIYKDYGISLNGRGGEVFLNSKDGERRYEIGAMDKAYRLFKTPYGKGNSFWGRYEYESTDGKKHFNSTFVYDVDSLQNRRDMLASAYRSLVSKQNLEIEAGALAGTTTGFSSDSIRKFGFAAEVKLRATFGKFMLVSDNFASTAYFPGRRRGGLNLSERLSYNLEKYRFYASLNHFGYNPKFISRSQGISNKFSLTRIQAGATRNWGNFSATLFSNYSRESRTMGYSQGISEASLSSKRIGLGLNYKTKNYKHSVFLNAEIGESHLEWINENEFQAKIWLDYNWGIFNLRAEYQKSGFYIGEVIYNQAVGGEYERWRINPNLRATFFNNKLSVDAGASFAHETNSGDRLLFRTGANYKLPYGIELFASLDYYKYSYLHGDYSSRYLEFGLIKKFGTPSFETRKNNLEIFVYREMNGDYSYTPDVDEIAVGQLVYIDGKAFRVNEEGKVKFRKIPEGSYTVRFDKLLGWYAPDRELEIKDNTNISIGLSKMTTIRGSVGYSSTILSYDISEKLLGLNVLAVDESGKTYSTRTTDNGNFVLFVPQGKYTVSLIVPGIMEYVEVIDNGKIAETNPNSPEKIEFNIEVKEKKVEYKKFSSSQ